MSCVCWLGGVLTGSAKGENPPVPGETRVQQRDKTVPPLLLKEFDLFAPPLTF